ncbi:MAG TPA: hypothetical protein VN462_04420 [Negativicutes bacterium]|nr:hypothetical protein [Negativicutes bacterium]
MSENPKDLITQDKPGKAGAAAPEAKGASSDGNQSFTVLGKGSTKGRLENGKLVPNGQTLIVDNEAFQPGVIPGIDRIWLTSGPGVFYDYTIHVQGACLPKAWDNKLEFTDESGDTYILRIYSSSAKEHSVNYHSSAGKIIKITWDI